MNEEGLKIDFLEYIKIKIRIKKLVEEIKPKLPIIVPYLPIVLFDIDLSNKGCSRTYNKLMNYDTNILKELKDKWEINLNVWKWGVVSKLNKNMGEVLKKALKSLISKRGERV